MILKSLYSLYDRLASDDDSGIPPLQFAPKKVSFRVTISRDGSIFSIAPVKDATNRQKFRNEIVPEHKIRSSTQILPQFMCDRASYCLGITPESSSDNWNKERFEAFKDFHLAAEKEINCEDFSIFCRFLQNWKSASAKEFDKANPDKLSQCINCGIFDIQGNAKAIHEHPAVRAWWLDQEPDPLPTGQCLLTGNQGPIARLHPKIKGFPKAASLVGVQKRSSYESYELKQAYTAPTSPTAAFKYAAALNWLVDGKGKPKHRFDIGDTTCVAWTDQNSVVDEVAALFFHSSSKQDTDAQNADTLSKLSVFLKAVQKGKRVLTELGEDPDETNFFILGIEQPNSGRYAIRYFMESSVSELLENLRQHHFDISIIRGLEENTTKGKAQPEMLSCRELLNQTAVVLPSGKLDYKTIPPLLGGALMRAILQNTPYPEALYSAVIGRIRADRTINYHRAAIIKGVLTRNPNHNISHPITIMLDSENSDTAYLHGRLFAALEKVQEEGHKEQTGRKRESTIRDKYFSSACATPASIFPRLETLSTHYRRHLKPRRKVQFDQLIGDIKWRQSGTPKVQSLEQQGLFILGYYHQRKALFLKKSED